MKSEPHFGLTFPNELLHPTYSCFYYFAYFCLNTYIHCTRDEPRVSSTRVKPGFSTKLETRVIKIKTRVPEKFQILLFFTIFSYILSYLSFLLIVFLFSPTFFSYFQAKSSILQLKNEFLVFRLSIFFADFTMYI